ncbi:MAG: glycosyltransferase family 2 protein [Candidatus Levybacteria bacterium]|nr:glycosyltransferase family 2 protein [Candidatus Levybacteria bacterium]
MISAIVLVKNQSHQLEKCLNSLLWCDEIIVIDDNSVDDSIEVAKVQGARIFTRSLNNNFSSQRQFGLSKAKNEWVLYVDADEIVTPELANEIYQQITQFLSPVNGYFIKRKDVLWGKTIKFGDAGRTKLLRLARKNKATWSGDVHEKWTVLGETGTFKSTLIHYPHQSVREFLSEIDYYSTIRAKELKNKNVKSDIIRCLFYPLGKFLYLYFYKLGFLDGVAGIISAIMMSFYTFLVAGKLWMLYQEKKTYDFGY